MFFNKKKKENISPSNLTYPFYKFIRADKHKHFDDDVLRWMDGTRNINITGTVGSGKTTGSADSILRAFLKHDLGGCIRTVKSDETQRILNLIEQAGKLHKVKIFEPKGKYKFNFLQYEAERLQDDGGGFVESVSALFMTVVNIANRMSGSGQSMGKEAFWTLAMERLLKASLSLALMAKKSAQMDLGANESDFEISIPNLSKIIRDAPVGAGHLHKFENLSPPTNMSSHQTLQTWANKSYTLFCMCWAERYINALSEKLEISHKQLKELEQSQDSNFDIEKRKYSKLKEDFESEERSFEVVKSYFLSEYSQLAEKTRSSIVEHYHSFSSSLRSGILADMFSTTTSPEIMPENLFKNDDIILLNMPVLKYGNLGIIGQTIFSKIWRDASLRRNVTPHTMPIFNYCDEAQYMMTEDEIRFNTVSRSARMMNVYITQSVTNYYGMLGGESAKPLVESLLGNLAVNIFHNSTSAQNNEYASELIGKDYRGNVTAGENGSSVSEEYQFKVLPKEFQSLKTGGQNNDFEVEAIITISDKKFSNGKNYMKVIFKQNFN